MSDTPPVVAPVGEMPTAEEIVGGRLASVPWPSSRAIVALGIELLPTIEDDLTADIVEHLLLALVDRDDVLLALRTVLSAALEQSHTLHVDNGRLQRRLADLLDAQRRERLAA